MGSQENDTGVTIATEVPLDTPDRGGRPSEIHTLLFGSSSERHSYLDDFYFETDTPLVATADIKKFNTRKNHAIAWWSIEEKARLNNRVKTGKVDGRTLWFALLLKYGPRNHRLVRAKQIENMAASLQARPPGESLTDWFNREHLPPGQERPEWRIKGKATVPSTAIPDPRTGTIEPPQLEDLLVQHGVSGLKTPEERRTARFERRRANWEKAGAWRFVEEAVQGAWEVGDTFVRGGQLSEDNLFGLLLARGVSAARILKDLKENHEGKFSSGSLIGRAAQVLAGYHTGSGHATFDDWYSNQGAKELDAAGVGRTIEDMSPTRSFLGTADSPPRTKAAEDAKEDVEESFEDPPVLDGDGNQVRLADGRILTEKMFAPHYQKMVTLSQFYRGDKLSKEEAVGYFAAGLTGRQISKRLSKDLPSFLRSGAWKEGKDAYITEFRGAIGAFRDLSKEQKTVHQRLIRKAILNKWSPGVYADKLRLTKAYVGGREFRDTSLGLERTYAGVFGGPITSDVRRTIGEAALAGISAESFASWLRAQPEYGTSVEMQRRVNRLSKSLSILGGSSPTRSSARVVPNPPAQFAIPDDPRIAGGAGLGEEGEQRVQAGVQAGLDEGEQEDIKDSGVTR